MYFHLHKLDEAGECHTGMWVVEDGNLAATMLAGLQALITGELPDQIEPPLLLACLPVRGHINELRAAELRK